MRVYTMTAQTRIAVLLAVYALLAAVSACSRQPSPQPQAAATPTSTPPVETAGLSPDARQVVAWLPGSRPVAGWKAAGAPQAFGPDNLWESIDGGAETYVTFGFQELVRLTCTQPDLATEATIEVYRMGDVLGAFGIYAQERNPGATFVQAGAEGYTAPNIVNFWNGPYYVKLTSRKTDDRVAAALLALASEISRGIGTPAPMPAGALALPARDQVAHSVKYTPRDILGQSYLVNGFEAQYLIGAKTCRLVAMAFDAAPDATAAFERYRKYVGTSAPAPKGKAPIEATFAGSDTFNGAIVAARAGKNVAIALGCPSPQAAVQLITATLSR